MCVGSLTATRKAALLLSQLMDVGWVVVRRELSGLGTYSECLSWDLNPDGPCLFSPEGLCMA